MNAQKLVSFFREFLHPENFTNLAAVIIALVLGYQSIKAGTTEQYFQAVLAVLGILAIAQLVSGYSSGQRDNKISQVSESMNKLQQNLNSKVSIDKLLFHRSHFPSLEVSIKNAKQIDVLGIGLGGLVVTYLSLLRERRDAGCRIRLIHTSSDYEIANLLARKFPELHSPEMHISHVETAIQAVSNMLETNISSGKLEIRTLNSVPPFGLFIIDGDFPNGQIRVELYPDACPIHKRPVFELLAKRDRDWYSFFKRNFETTWNVSSEVN